MGSSDGGAPHRVGLVPSRLRRQLVLAFTPLVLVAIVGLSVASYHSAATLLREQILQQLHALRVSAAHEIERHFSRLEVDVLSVARDPGTLSALQQLRDATAELDTNPVTESAKMRPQMESLKRFLEDYYEKELRAKTLDLRSLLLPQRSAVWLQAAYVARSREPNVKPDYPSDATLYARHHAAWDPVFQGMLDRFGFQDLLLIDAISGRVVYSARKRPDFQTSLLDGAYAGSRGGALFQELQKSSNSTGYRIVDLAPYPPAHDTTVAFAGAPIVDSGATVGVIVVQLSVEPINHLLSADGQWSERGLGETGDLYVVGRGDTLMRSEPRAGAERGTSILRQRVESHATTATIHTDDYAGEYVSYRGVPVLGSAARLSHISGLNWTLVAEMSSTEALRPLSQLRNRTVWLAGLLLVGALLLSLGVSTAMAARVHSLQLLDAATASDLRADESRRRLEADLRPVVAAAVAASEGDLSQRIMVDGGLLGDLRQALNRLLRTTGALVSHVHSTCTAVIDSATQIQAAVRQLSQDAVRHTNEITSTNTRLRELQVGVDGLAAEAALATNAAQSTDATARQSTAAVAQVIADLETLQDGTRTLALKMKRLGERSMEISTVTTTIQEITAQANMVALNATIEASRAGEHGLGFKTVANDVRKLAARTEAAAKDMAALVTTLHGEAADAAAAIDEHAEQIVRQVSAVGDANDALSHCRDVVAQNGERLAALSAATGQHVRTADKLSSAVLGVADFIRRVHVLSEQAVHSSAALLSMLFELNTWTQTFRVEEGGDGPASSTACVEVIELGQHEAVGNGRNVGA